MGKFIAITFLLFQSLYAISQHQSFQNKLDSLEERLSHQTGNEWLLTACQLSFYWGIDGINAEKAINLANEGIAKLPENYFHDLERLRDKTSFLNNLAQANIRLGQYGAAQKYVNQGIKENELIRPFNDSIATHKEGRFRLLAAEILFYQKHYDKQITELQKAADAFVDTKKWYNWAGAMNNLGSTYKLLEQYDSAIYYFRQCDTLFLQFDYAEYLTNQVIIAEALLRKGDLEQADSIYRFFLGEGEKDNHRQLQAAYVGLGEVSLKKDEPSAAIQWFKKAEPMVEKNKDPYRRIGIYKLLAEAYETANNKSNGLVYYKKYLNLYDSVSATLYGEQLIQLQNEFALNEQDEVIRSLEESAHKTKIKFWGVIISCLLLFVGGGVWLRRYLREFQKPTVIEWSTLTETLLEEKAPFVIRSMEIINDHLDEPDFTVEAFAKEMRISRVQLFNKTKKHFSTSPSRLIRQARLEKAKLLLQNQQLNVSEVAYRVGFVNASHFTKVFRKHFGKPPTEMFADRQ